MSVLIILLQSLQAVVVMIRFRFQSPVAVVHMTKLGNGKYIARVNSVTDDCKITVSVDGKVAGVSQFRVRTIPTPTATVGGVNQW